MSYPRTLLARTEPSFAHVFYTRDFIDLSLKFKSSIHFCLFLACLKIPRPWPCNNTTCYSMKINVYSVFIHLFAVTEFRFRASYFLAKHFTTESHPYGHLGLDVPSKPPAVLDRPFQKWLNQSV